MKKLSLKKMFNYAVISFFAVFFTSNFAVAEEAPGASETVYVIGSKPAATEILGSGSYLEAEEWRNRGYDDINRALRSQAGIYLREEDGYGLFPNISLRGVDTQRTSKLTIMEDGIPTAPAPYSAPAAYYSPATGRMSAIEVLKGSSQIEYGPHTTGGIINYVSTPVPETPRAFFSSSFGSDNDFRLHAYAGNSWEKDKGRFGALAEIYTRRTEGFKEIKRGSLPAVGNTYVDDNTGFLRIEGMAKMFWEPNTDWYQHFEFKVGHTSLSANETYLGLSDEDFRQDPYQRYFASYRDHIDTEQYRTYLRWMTKPLASLSVTLTGFYNKFERNWYKYHGGSSLRDSNLDFLRGDAIRPSGGLDPREFEYRNNRRFYNSKGIDSRVEYLLSTGEVSHKLRAGIRWMSDEVRRDQNDESFQITDGDDGSITIEDDGRCSGNCRKQNSNAVALFISDEMNYWRFRLAPGIRYEHVKQEAKRYNYDPGSGSLILQEGEDRSGSISAFSPGVSAGFSVTEGLNLFAGIHRGIFLPSPSAHLRSGLNEETSVASEVGMRFREGFFYLDATLFHTKLNDLIVVDNIGGGGGGDDQNAGNVEVKGVEIQTGFDLASQFGLSGFYNPWRFSITLTDATLDSDASSDDIESLFAGGRDGNKVPYIPDYQVSIGTGIELGPLGVFLDVYWVGETFTTAENFNTPPVDGSGEVTDYRRGKTDSYGIADISGYIRLTDELRLTASAHNIFDKKYIVSRHPIGPRPGLPRTFLAGIKADLN